MGAKLSKKGNYNALEAERTFKTYIKYTDRKDNFLYNANVSVFKSHSHRQSCDDLKSATLRPFDRNKQRKSIPKTMSCIELSSIKNVREKNITDGPDVIGTENKLEPVIDTSEIDSTMVHTNNILPKNNELLTDTTELNTITAAEDDTYPQTPEDTLYALIQKLKTLKKRIKHYDGTENIATIQFQLDIYYNELEAIQSEKTMVNELRNKVLEKIRHFKQVLTEKDLKPQKSPNKDAKTSQKQYLEETFNKFQNLTTTLDVLKEDIIDYYGTSDDAQFGTIMLKLDDCRNVLADIDPRGDVRIIISKEEYEDYIIRLVKQFQKIVRDNEQDFEVCRMTLSTIDRRKDRRKRSRNIEINYPTNQEQQELILLDLETPGRNNYDFNDYLSGGSRKDSDEVGVSETDDDQKSFQSNIFQIDDLGETVDGGKRVKMNRMMSQESEDEFYDCYEVIPLESPGFNRSFSYGEGLGCIKEVSMLEDSVTVNGFADIFGRNVRKISNVDDLHVSIDNKVSYDLQDFPSESAAGKVIVDNDENYFSNQATSCGANGGIILTPEVYLENLKELTFDKHISNENNLVEIEQQGCSKELAPNKEQTYLNTLCNDDDSKKELLLKLNIIEEQGHLNQLTNEAKVLSEDIQLSKLEHEEDLKGCSNKLEQHEHLKEFKCAENESEFHLNKLKQEEILKELKCDENDFENSLTKLDHQEELKFHSKLPKNIFNPSNDNNLPRVISIHEPNGLVIDLCDESNETNISANQNMGTEQSIKRLECDEEDCTVGNLDRHNIMNKKCTDDFNTLQKLRLDEEINSETNLREEVLRNYQIDSTIEASKHSNIRKDILSNKPRDENCGLNQNELVFKQDTHQESICFKDISILKNNRCVDDSNGNITVATDTKHKPWLETDVISNFVKPEESRIKNIQTDSFSKSVLTKDRNDITINPNINKIHDVWLQENRTGNTDEHINYTITKPKRVIKKISSKTDLVEPDHSDHEYHSEAEDTVAELKPIPTPRRYYRSKQKINPITFNIPIITCENDGSLSSSADEEDDNTAGNSTEYVNKFDTELELPNTVNTQDTAIRSDEIDGSETFDEVTMPEKRRDIDINYATSQEQQGLNLLDVETPGRNNTAESSNVLSNNANKQNKASNYLDVGEDISNKLIAKDSTTNIVHNTNKSVDKLALDNNFNTSKNVKEELLPKTSNVKEELLPKTSNVSENGLEIFKTCSTTENAAGNRFNRKSTLQDFTNNTEKPSLSTHVEKECIIHPLSTRCGLEASNTCKNGSTECAPLNIINKQEENLQEMDLKAPGGNNNDLNDFLSSQKDSKDIAVTKIDKSDTNKEMNILSLKNKSDKSHKHQENANKLLDLTTTNNNIGENFNKQQETHQRNSKNELEKTNISNNQQASFKNVSELNTVPQNHMTKQQGPSKNSRHVELELNIVNDCVEDMQLCVNEFDGDKTDENYSNIYKNLFDSMSILNKIKSADTVIIKRKQAILSQIMLCMRELEMKVS